MTTQPADTVADVRSLLDMIRAGCADVDRTRALPRPVVEALREQGVFRLLVPRTLGGAEADPLTFARVVEQVSYADGSAGWCAMIGGCYATFGGMLPPAAAREVFGDRRTIAAGNFRPDVGAAHEVEGGYRLSGRWSLGSGSSHATWYVTGAIVLRDGEPVILPNGQPRMRELFVPASEVEVVDTWDSTGLRGTASHDYVIRESFVPSERTVWFQEPPSEDGPLYRMPPIAMFASFIASVHLGICRHALDSFVELAATKVPVLAQATLADKPAAQAALGRARALHASSRAYLEAELARLWERVSAGDAPTLADRGELWLASVHAAHAAYQAVELLYTAAGSSAVYASSPLDRCLRDARTALQHICSQDLSYELAGRQALGRDVLAGAWGMDYRGEGEPPEPAADAVPERIVAVA